MSETPVAVQSVHVRDNLYALTARTTVLIPEWHVARLDLVSGEQVLAFNSQVATHAGIYALDLRVMGPWPEAEGRVLVYCLPPRDLMEMARRLGLSFRGATPEPEWDAWEDDDLQEA